MKKYLPLLFSLLVCGCKPDQKKIHYPDCLSGAATNMKVLMSCGRVFVAFESAPGQALALVIDSEKAGLSSHCSYFNYPQDSAMLHLEYHTYTPSPDSVFFNWCSDVVFSEKELGKSLSWVPLRGQVTASTSVADANADPCENYLLTLEAKDLLFVNPVNGDTASFGRVSGRDLRLGGCIP